MGFWGKFFRRRPTLLTARSRPKPDAYKFANAESFRFLTEGLRAMQEWQRTGSEDKRLEALSHFQASCEKYPQDLIARFYRACLIAQKDYGRDPAISEFRIIVDRAAGTEMAAFAQRNIDVLSEFEYREEKKCVD